MEIYWNHLLDLSRHPAFKNESPIIQQRMMIFSEGLRKLDTRNWMPHPVAEAPERNLRIAQDAAYSRL
jgi:hypothetical protein